ncbi:GSCOCG00002725001-RA-CDS [Cotesia congregata]|nr:GSCOCG00002725001-RA-CDS [Cotesia congregata]
MKILHLDRRVFSQLFLFEYYFVSTVSEDSEHCQMIENDGRLDVIRTYHSGGSVDRLILPTDLKVDF